MNAKQTAPLIVTLPTLAAVAPPLIIGGAIGLGVVLMLKWFLSDDDKEKKPQTVPANNAESPRNKPGTAVFRQIPAEIPVKPAAVAASVAPRVVVPLLPVPPVSKVPSPAPVPVVPVTKVVISAPPMQPIKKKLLTRENMAAIFHRGAHTLTRKAAVEAMKNLGFGKTAAYAALSTNGRFASWLQIAPDGMITWKAD